MSRGIFSGSNYYNFEGSMAPAGCSLAGVVRAWVGSYKKTQPAYKKTQQQL